MPILITSAVEFEVTPTLSALSELGIAFDFFPFGIGPLAAAAHAPELAAKAEGKAVIYIGTCGVFGEFRSPYLITADQVIWSPIGERTGIAYGVKDSAPPVEVPSSMRKISSSLPTAAVICAPSISLEPYLPKVPPLTDPVVENLELYSVTPTLLRVAASLDIILGVTNAIGPEAHLQWNKNFKPVAEQTAQFIREQMICA